MSEFNQIKSEFKDFINDIKNEFNEFIGKTNNLNLSENMNTELKEYQIRMLIEFKELTDKIQKLINSGHLINNNLLKEQLKHMMNYKNILEERLLVENIFHHVFDYKNVVK